MRGDWQPGLAVVAVAMALLAIACGPPSAEDLVNEVLRKRNEFDVRLTSWIVRNEGTAEAHIYLDVVVLKPAEAADVNTLTVLVEQVDAGGSVLHSQRVPLDVRNIDAGFSQNVSREVRPVAPGVEGISLRVESSPPREAWAEFPELDRVRPRT